MLEPRAVRLLQPDPVVEETLAIALERGPGVGIGELDVDLPDLLIDLDVLQRCAHIALLERDILLGQAGEAEGLDAGG